MEYNPADAALVYIDQAGFLKVHNFAGKAISRPIQDKERRATEIQALLTTGLLIKTNDSNVIINPDHVAKIFYNGDLMTFQSAEGETIVQLTANQKNAENFLNSLTRPGSPYLTVPGRMECVSVRALSDIRMNHDKVDFFTHKGEILCTSQATRPDVSQSILALGKAAIATCQAARPASVAGKTPPLNAPAPELTEAEREKLKNLARDLKEVVFEQPEAIDLIADVVICAEAGLKKKNKPVGSFLLLGPTGVGKTETAVQLAEKLGVPFKKFDMSEYMEKHDVARLIGAPPGYIGMEAGAQLCDFVRNNPKCVIDFDEIEKAHPDVFNILLQVLDDAKLTDGQGNTVDFSQAIIIMTSNLGTSNAAKPTMGFVRAAEKPASGDPRDDKAVKEFFSAEFRNRLTAVLQYNSLSRAVAPLLVSKFISEVKGFAAEKNVILTTTPEADTYLAKNGYHSDYGARALERLILSQVKIPLAREIMFGELENGGRALVKLENEKLSLQFNAATGIANDNIATVATATVSNVTALRTMQGPAFA